jgi:hypothetical protein
MFYSSPPTRLINAGRPLADCQFCCAKLTPCRRNNLFMHHFEYGRQYLIYRFSCECITIHASPRQQEFTMLRVLRLAWDITHFYKLDS